MFHEFGHALHGMFAAQTYPTLSGTNVARDFVEFPSQFNENWALDPKVLPHYAVHYQTGQPIPQDAGRQDQARREPSTRAMSMGEAARSRSARPRLALAARRRAAAGRRQVRSAGAASGGFDTADVPPRYRSSYFLHIWSNGYSAGYYAYPWTRMLGQDAFNWFETHGGLTRANGQRFRDMVLSRGNTLDYAADVPRLRRPRSEHQALSRILRTADERRRRAASCASRWRRLRHRRPRRSKGERG